LKDKFFMNISDFPYPKINLPKDLKDEPELFDGVEKYLTQIEKYIFTNIDLREHGVHSWILQIVSANLVRSLYIRNSFVDSINSRNIVAMFLNLKAWLEIVGVLSSVLDILKQDLSDRDLHEKIKPYALGNRGSGSMRVGTIEVVNVLTMIKKSDNYMKAISKDEKLSNFFSDFYDVASNPTHPSYDSYEFMGDLKDDAIWNIKNPNDFKKQLITYRPMYGGLLLSPIFIELICSEIFDIEKDNFRKVKSESFFQT